MLVIRVTAMCRRNSVLSSPCFKHKKLILIDGLKVNKTEVLSTVACIVLEGRELHTHED